DPLTTFPCYSICETVPLEEKFVGKMGKGGRVPARDEGLGRGIRLRRKDLGLRLEDLSQKSGLSPSYISAVERGRVNPSIAALKRIAEALGCPLAEFFQSEAAQGAGTYVVRRKERKILVYPGETVRMELLAP